MLKRNILQILISSMFSLFCYPTAHASKVSKEYIEDAIQYASQKADVPAELLRAICKIESNLNPHAFAFEDGGADNHSFGMCQVSRINAEKFLGKDANCEKDFRNLPRSYAACKYFGPKLNALAAAKYLRMQLDRYDGHAFKAAAAFNSGSLRVCSAKGWVTDKRGKRIQKCKPGDLLNRYYVQRVKKAITPAEDSQIRLADADFKVSSDRS